AGHPRSRWRRVAQSIGECSCRSGDLWIRTMRRSFIERFGAREIAFDSRPLLVEDAEAHLRMRLALLGRQIEPVRCLAIILHSLAGALAEAFHVTPTERRLRERESLVRSFSEPLHGFGFAPGDAASFSKVHGESVHGINLALFGGLAKPEHGL